ncbi:MAG: HEXXH motif-containing putative peptide modification protein [Cyanobacteriota bacterium]
MPTSTPPIQTCSPWAWQPTKAPAYQKLKDLVFKWQSAGVLKLDSAVLHRCLLEAAERQEKWLLHPCSHPLTLQSQPRIQSDFQLAVWMAAHVNASLGSVYVPYTLWAWGPNGGMRVDPGLYDLQELGVGLANQPENFAIALDVWSDSVGFPFPDSLYPDEWCWSASRTLSDAQQQRLQQEIVLFLNAMHLLTTRLPECADWVTSVTQVVIPFHRQVGNSFKSSSNVGLPGVVFFDLHGGEIQILEALVHESAHLHFCVAEAGGSLVDPNHHGKYKSALRTDARPLRGIYLAYHALAYICVFYTEYLKRGIITGYEEELQSLRAKRDDSEHTLACNQQFLTQFGIEFFEQTRKVSSYGS